MSTPRRPAPRSRPAPMTATGCSVFEPLIPARLIPARNGRRADHGRPRRRRRRLSRVAPGDNGLQAIDLVDALDPDAAVVDLHMPLLDGVTAIAKLRQNHPSLCLIALTGDADRSLHDAVKRAGADAVLEKGAMVEALIERLTKVRAA